ncbi:hypothetical protein [Nitrosomonas sp. Nm132]|uniref:hypothetical protein n=1 Tax=Nitrosomonas sp. Nm132 TaxID=1881053 RepID=UPI0008864764|nr:hypothetical protein [Nitrosomonas sp. Nm132]SDH90821.1 hypothetical protein SAMN05428952_104220 [Nitrosomonas sp. Nm132]
MKYLSQNVNRPWAFPIQNVKFNHGRSKSKKPKAFTADPQTAVPLLAAIATARSLTVAELAFRIMSNRIAFSNAAGTPIGRRQVAEDLIDLAVTKEDVAVIAW